MKLHAESFAQTKQAFSLVELSIVLVILGLLVGGVLSGQSLIRAAELRSLSSEVSRYTTAAYTFRDKYFALPGDMPNATAFWGAAPNCSAQTASGIATCNGNGDGLIGWGGTNPERAETFTFWQQMANAGLIEGNYTGVRGTPGGFPAATNPGLNSPRTRIANGCWTVYNNVLNAVWNLTTTTSVNAFIAGSLYVDGSGPDFCHNPLVKPEEMWNIDTKIDDGRPGQGSVVSRNQTTDPNCVSSNDPGTAQYNLNITSAACSVSVLLR